MMRRGEFIINTKMENQFKNAVFTRNLNDGEISGWQWTGGYVILNLYKKLKNAKNIKVSVSFNKVSAWNRGGLLAIKEDMQKIFLVVEKYSKTWVEKNFIIKITFDYIVIIFNNIVWVAETKAASEVTKNVLASITKLYIKVRTHIFARDIVQKNKSRL